jgi:hypothetical protein
MQHGHFLEENLSTDEYGKAKGESSGKTLWVKHLHFLSSIHKFHKFSLIPILEVQVKHQQ